MHAGKQRDEHRQCDGDVEQPTAPLPVGGGGLGTTTSDANLSGWVLTTAAPTFPPASTTTSPWLNYPTDPSPSPSPYVEGAHQARTEPNHVPAQYAGLSPPLARPDHTGELGPGLIGRTSEPSRAGAPAGTPASVSASAELTRARSLRKAGDFDFMRDDALALLGESREGLMRVKRIVQDLRDFSRGMDRQQSRCIFQSHVMCV